MGSKCEVFTDEKMIYIGGRIDELFYENISMIPLFGDVQFNFRDLVSINSSGLREWILLMRKMAAAKITVHECPKFLIDQINMVKGVLPSNAKVVSFYVPFFNEKNGTEKSVLFTLNKEFTENSVLPFPIIIDEKGDEMLIDVIETKYFKFIKG